MIVYELTFFFHRLKGFLVVEPFSLGLYSSFDSIQLAKKHYISQPGFCDSPEAFSMRRRDVKGVVEHSEIFETLLYFHTKDYAYEYCIELGLYGNKRMAHEALSIFVKDNEHLFYVQDLIAEKIINRHILDKRDWEEGYST